MSNRRAVRLVVLVCALLMMVGCSRHSEVAYVSRTDNALASDRPFVITVLGDSTGNQPTEWVGLIAQRIADEYGRVVTMHNWSPDANRYVSDTVFGTAGAPVVIWNGSAAGKTAQYSIEWFSTLSPEASNLTIINHGHNSPLAASDGIKQLTDMAYAEGTDEVAIVLQNPRADKPDRAALEAETFKQIGQRFGDPTSPTDVIDVFSAFPTDDSLRDLLEQDGIHPNQAGQQLWADTVASALGLR